MPRLVSAVALAALGFLGCNDPAPSAGVGSAEPAASAGPRHVDWVTMPAGDEPIAEILAREVPKAQAEGRQVLVYVGATWCEPCKRFHDAAAAGQLDAAFPNLRFLEFDADRDEQRLQAAGCQSKLIPLFARPTPDGRCHPEQRHMGGIKGPGAVPFITERLRAMLARSPS